MKKKSADTDDVKPDLKHDTMEYSAGTDGDDQLDTDDATYEEEGITAEELDAIEDSWNNEAAALNTAELDKQADTDTLPDEDWLDDTKDEDDEEMDEEEEEQHRK